MILLYFWWVTFHQKSGSKFVKNNTDLKIRLIYHRLQTRIKAHILISFLVLECATINEIIINAGVLKNEFQNTQHADYIQNIFHAGNHLLALVNKILQATNIQNNSFTVEEHAVSIVELVSDIVEAEKENAQKKGLQLSVH